MKVGKKSILGIRRKYSQRLSKVQWYVFMVFSIVLGNLDINGQWLYIGKDLLDSEKI